VLCDYAQYKSTFTLTRIAFVYYGPKGMELAPNPHYSGLGALGGSFKLVMLTPKTVREMTQLPKETQKNGDTNKSKGTNKHAKHKPRLIMYTQKHSAQAGCMNWSW